MSQVNNWYNRMGRYWIDVPYVSDMLMSEDEKTELQKQLNAEIESLAPVHLEELGSCFKVRGFEKARRLADDLLEILEKYEEKGDLNLVAIAEVSRQPECPECGRLGRFKDQYCPEDGADMIPAENWDLEEFVEMESE